MTSTTERNLVTVETIRDIRPIDGADAIEAATVRGWTVVVKKGEFAVGDAVLYFEIDSQLPLNDERFAFLAPRGEKNLEDGRRVHRLKTARLRGVYSQGLVLPYELFPEVTDPGSDIAVLLGVDKYEPPLPSGTNIVGAFPSDLVRKTDSERVQNLGSLWDDIVAAGPWVATEKADGTSLTVLRDSDGVLRVCSRNWELGEPESRASANLYWRAVYDAGIDEALTVGESLQAEIVGPGIQGNPLNFGSVTLVVFSYLRGGVPQSRDQLEAYASGLSNVVPAPVYDMEFPASIEDAVAQVDGIKSLLTPGRLTEGVVWHTVRGNTVDALGGRSTFKVISNKYLSKQKD